MKETAKRKKAAKRKESPVNPEKSAPAGYVKTIRLVAAPVLRLKLGVTCRIKIIDSEVGARLAGKYLLPAVDFETGKTVQMALPADVVKIFEAAYPGRSYLGRWFEITKHRYVSESKAYSRHAAYSINEFEGASKAG